ncbi:hypothetical protein WME75_39990 [Sorangium sp. So ce1014]|uniref:hypothetical protein n=1 Tax=Sorangium sp. So ce1014 TaxID=3133326 RepID=UPI003F62287D
MKIEGIMLRMGVVSVCMSGLVLSGCLGSAEGEVSEEALGEAEQAIGAECAGATATATFNGWADWVSVQTYDTTSCYKGVVVDVNNIDAPGGVSLVDAYWADSIPTTQAACEDSWIQMDVFERVSGNWVYQFSLEDNGTWNAGQGTCQKPVVGTGVTPGHTFRFSMTARTFEGSTAPTRKVGMYTYGIS